MLVNNLLVKLGLRKRGELDIGLCVQIKVNKLWTSSGFGTPKAIGFCKDLMNQPLKENRKVKLIRTRFDGKIEEESMRLMEASVLALFDPDNGEIYKSGRINYNYDGGFVLDDMTRTV